MILVSVIADALIANALFCGERGLMEVLFVIGFFVVLLLTGVSVIGVLVALFAGAVLLMFSGFLLLAMKLLPWLLLAVAVAWIYQTVIAPKSSPPATRRFDKTMAKIDRMNRRG
ncbi:envelope stress response protein PspG [Tatumella ptyseos]|uniref:Phage shock protein G n=2 Tax=Tatumella ptyseos TaxID=82987 RepID=A0A2X5NWD0_9GAMM|nr:envelope stress response protein PspG [Tatumella ptyseos]SQK77027.1 Phage shock protein G [Tatumella ptyseos]